MNETPVRALHRVLAVNRVENQMCCPFCVRYEMRHQPSRLPSSAQWIGPAGQRSCYTSSLEIGHLQRHTRNSSRLRQRSIDDEQILKLAARNALEEKSALADVSERQ